MNVLVTGGAGFTPPLFRDLLTRAVDCHRCRDFAADYSKGAACESS
ncbi:MAG: hypothetical protein HYZ89_00425 [Candidatus Omnitrophica bacterium]|nr:hypothetical protein [Candidatus Omnitrophota bacterium]